MRRRTIKLLAPLMEYTSMDEISISLLSGLLGALIGSYVTIKINSFNRKIAAVEKMLSIVYPLGYKSWWEPEDGKSTLIFHESYPRLWEAQASLRSSLSFHKRKKFDTAWKQFMAIEGFDEIPNTQPSKIFTKGVYNSRDEAVKRSADFVKYLNKLR